MKTSVVARKKCPTAVEWTIIYQLKIIMIKIFYDVAFSEIDLPIS